MVTPIAYKGANSWQKKSKFIRLSIRAAARSSSASPSGRTPRFISRGSRTHAADPASRNLIPHTQAPHAHQGSKGCIRSRSPIRRCAAPMVLHAAFRAADYRRVGFHRWADRGSARPYGRAKPPLAALGSGARADRGDRSVSAYLPLTNDCGRRPRPIPATARRRTWYPARIFSTRLRELTLRWRSPVST